jgi:hypothetical protein
LGSIHSFVARALCFHLKTEWRLIPIYHMTLSDNLYPLIPIVSDTPVKYSLALPLSTQI